MSRHMYPIKFNLIGKTHGTVTAITSLTTVCLFPVTVLDFFMVLHTALSLPSSCTNCTLRHYTE